jgi:hypothetical protein
MNPTWRKTLVEQISDEAHSIRNDLATTHNASALAFGLLVLRGFSRGDFAHYPCDVCSLDRPHAQIAY